MGSLSRWWLLIVLLVALVAVAAIFSRKSVRTEIVIPADAGSIWSVLMNAAEYRSWNPVLVPLSGKIELGANIRYRWNQPQGEPIEMESKVVELIDYHLLHQRGGTPGLLTFDHRYELFPEDNGTRVVQSEIYKGIGVWFWNAKQMEPQYQKVNEALLAKVIEAF